jgi:hypothetical protein
MSRGKNFPNILSVKTSPHPSISVPPALSLMCGLASGLPTTFRTRKNLMVRLINGTKNLRMGLFSAAQKKIIFITD